MNKTSKSKVFLAGLTMFLGGIGLYGFLKDVLQFDIDWSVHLSELFCKKNEWIRKSTLPLSSIIRTSVCIMAYGVFKSFRPTSQKASNIGLR